MTKGEYSLDKKAAIFALFAEPNRLKILRFLQQVASANVTDIATEVAMSIACTSHHLQLLKEQAVVTTKRKGNSIYYAVNKQPFIQELLQLLTF